MSPDCHIEEYWLFFKQSMSNFYNITHVSPRPIQMWSDNLNLLQSTKQYEMIEHSIRDYMSLYAIDILRHCNNYHINILLSNIKKWNILSLKYNFASNDMTKYHNIIFLLVDIYNSVTNKCTNIDRDIINIFSMVEYYILYEKFDNLIIYAVTNNKPSILDKINKYKNSYLDIERLYCIKLANNMSGKKILLLCK